MITTAPNQDDIRWLNAQRLLHRFFACATGVSLTVITSHESGSKDQFVDSANWSDQNAAWSSLVESAKVRSIG